MKFLKNQSSYQRKLKETVNFFQKRLGPPPEVAVVFGSGLGAGWQARGKVERRLAYAKIPHFTPVAVKGHAGSLGLSPRGNSRSLSLLSLQGRRHYYEGLDPWEVVFPIRALAAWGVKRLVLTNASGSLNPRLRPGSLVALKDHINLMGFNPLMGPNLKEFGPRFPSLQNLYENPWTRRIKQVAKTCGLKMASGIYVAISGPSYETPAEVAAFRKLGGDLVGMSTVPEAIVAAHSGMEVAALAAVTNSCVVKGPAPNHEAVLRHAKKVDDQLTKLLLRLQREGIKS